MHTRCKTCRATRARSAALASTGYQPKATLLAQVRRDRRTQKELGVLTCTACGRTMPLSAFVPIKQSRRAYYGRCRACRAEVARERYRADPEERATQIQRAQRNRRKRLQGG